MSENHLILVRNWYRNAVLMHNIIVPLQYFIPLNFTC